MRLLSHSQQTKHEPFNRYKWLDCWVGSRSGDSTHISVVPGHPHVAIFTPVFTPRVFHDPVVTMSVTPVPYDKDCVVQDGGTAAVVVEDATWEWGC